jgi:ubiquinol-cytochrome c reductase cytochrome c subunit
VAPATGDLALGAELYEINCAACHSSTGAGGALTNGLIAPDILHSTPTEIAEAVRIGGAGLRSGHMPRFGPDVLSDHELDSIIRYIQDLQRRGDRGGAGLGRIGPVAEGFAGWFVGLFLLLLYVRYIGIRSRG